MGRARVIRIAPQLQVLHAHRAAAADADARWLQVVGGRAQFPDRYRLVLDTVAKRQLAVHPDHQPVVYIGKTDTVSAFPLQRGRRGLQLFFFLEFSSVHVDQGAYARGQVPACTEAVRALRQLDTQLADGLLDRDFRFQDQVADPGLGASVAAG